jgi:hypothetical protein
MARFCEVPAPEPTTQGLAAQGTSVAGAHQPLLGWWALPPTRRGASASSPLAPPRGSEAGPAGRAALPAAPAVQVFNADRSQVLRPALLKPAQQPLATLVLPTSRASGEYGSGPRIQLALPSFSGGTPACPHLLKYACDLWTRVRLVRPARVLLPPGPPAAMGACELEAAGATGGAGGPQAARPWRDEQDEDALLRPLLSGRPLIAIAFDDMTVGGRQLQLQSGKCTSLPLTH